MELTRSHMPAKLIRKHIDPDEEGRNEIEMRQVIHHLQEGSKIVIQGDIIYLLD